MICILLSSSISSVNLIPSPQRLIQGASGLHCSVKGWNSLRISLLGYGVMFGGFTKGKLKEGLIFYKIKTGVTIGGWALKQTSTEGKLTHRRFMGGKISRRTGFFSHKKQCACASHLAALSKFLCASPASPAASLSSPCSSHAPSWYFCGSPPIISVHRSSAAFVSFI